MKWYHTLALCHFALNFNFILPLIQVTEGVHMAIGFAVANSILLEGPDGLVIVDTTESEEAAREILQHFRNISSKPIVAVVYTHNHPDHCRGAKVWSDATQNAVLACHIEFHSALL